MRWRSGAVVRPDTGKNARRIAAGRAIVIAEQGAAAHALAILGNAVKPGAAAGRTIEGLKEAFLAARVVVIPLRAPYHQIDFGRGLDSDAADATVIEEVIRGAPSAAPVPVSTLNGPGGCMDGHSRLARFDNP